MDVACERSPPPPIPARFRTSDPVHGDGAPAASPIDDPDSRNGVYGPHDLVHLPQISPSRRWPPTIGGKGNPPPPPVVGYVHRRGRLKPRTTSAEVRQSKGDLYQGSEFYSLELLRLQLRAVERILLRYEHHACRPPTLDGCCPRERAP